MALGLAAAPFRFALAAAPTRAFAASPARWRCARCHVRPSASLAEAMRAAAFCSGVSGVIA